MGLFILDVNLPSFQVLLALYIIAGFQPIWILFHHTIQPVVAIGFFVE